MDLSGEPFAPQVSDFFLTESSAESSGTKIAANNIAKREYQTDYMDYWNNTINSTSTGRPVDAVITPVAPYPSVRPGLYQYYAYTSFVNVLDYPSCTIPVTTVDPKVDKKEENYKPRNEMDKSVEEVCKSLLPLNPEFCS